MSNERAADTRDWKAVRELRENSLGRLLMQASRRFNEAAIDRVRELGHPMITLAHASILPHIDIDGSRLGDVASRAAMTKQSASELVSALERLDYLVRLPDPSDGRAQLITFTERGRDFLMAAHRAKEELEQGAVEELGGDGSAKLIDLLKRYLANDEGGVRI